MGFSSFDSFKNKVRGYADDAVDKQLDWFEDKLKNYSDDQILRALNNPGVNYAHRQILEEEAARRGL